jgi:CRP/FNR family transcriptional regulator
LQKEVNPVNAHAQLKPRSMAPSDPSDACDACPPYEFGIFNGVTAKGTSHDHDLPPLLPLSEHTVPARRAIFRQREVHETVPFICRGWAATAITLLDGSRQILSFLLPGDIVSTSLLFGPTTHCSVEAVTDVHYRCFNRDELKASFLSRPELIEKLSRIWHERQLRAVELAVDLGRRTADERIARLILALRERLLVRGMARGQTMDFPLRQHHVGDATGLTAVHVSKVLSEFRRRGLIEINDRSLTILNPSEFHRVATMR